MCAPISVNFREIFFHKLHFYKHARLKLAKNQANVKQYLKAKLLLFENYSHSSFTLLSKSNGTYSKNK